MKGVSGGGHGWSSGGMTDGVSQARIRGALAQAPPRVPIFLFFLESNGSDVVGFLC